MTSPPRLTDLIQSVTGVKPQSRKQELGKIAVRRGVTIKLLTQVVQSLDELGGVDYLVKLGREDPKAYTSLLRAVIPQQIDVNDSSGLVSLLEERLNNARSIQADQMRRVAEHAKRTTIDGESRVVNTP